MALVCRSAPFLRASTRGRMLVLKCRSPVKFSYPPHFKWSCYLTHASNSTIMLTRAFSLSKIENVADINMLFGPTDVYDFQFQQELYIMQTNAKLIGWISPTYVKNIFEAMKQSGNVKSHEGLILIQHCGSFIPEMPAELRIKLVEDIWNTLPKLQCKFDVMHYNTLLRIHLDNEFKFDPLEFLDSMKQQNIEPTRVTYQRLLSCYCQVGDIKGAKSILKKMESEDLLLNEQIYHDLIIGHARTRDMESSKKILDIMRKSDIIPNSATYTALACGYIIGGDIDNMFLTLKRSEMENILLTDEDILCIVYTLIIHHHEKHLQKILPKLIFEEGYNDSCMKIVLELVNRGYHQSAFTLLNTMPRKRKTSLSYKILFIKQIAQQGLPLDMVLHYCSRLQDNEILEPVLLKATEIALLLQKPDDAVSLLKELFWKGSKLRCHFFWPLIMCYKAKENRIYDTLKLMLDLKCPAEFDTFLNFVFPFVSTIDPDSVLLRLKNMGYQVTDVLNPLCTFLVAKGNILCAAELLQKYPVRCMVESLATSCLAIGYVMTGDVASTIKILKHCEKHPLVQANTRTETDIFGNFIFELVKANGCKVSNLRLFLNHMKKENLKISSSAFELISQNLGNLSSFQIKTLLKTSVSSDVPTLNEDNTVFKKPENMSVEELQTYLVQRKAKGYRTVEVLHKLLMLHARNRDLRGVKEIIIELQKETYLYRGNTCSVLMEVFCHHGDLDRAMHYKRLLDKQFPRFCVDSFKIIDLATLLAKHKKFNDAESMIYNYHSAFGMGNKNEKVCVRNILNLLDSFANSEDANHARKIFEMLESCGYCEPTNVILGPLVKVHFLKNDLFGAVNEFLRIVEKYKKTPWQNELLKAVIQHGTSETLQKVVDAAETVHGKANSILDLATAYSECGLLQEAEKVFQMSDVKINDSRIIQLCENYVNKDKVDELESLLLVTKNLAEVNRDLLYYQLLRAYVNRDDVEKTLNVWSMMQENDVAPSNRTMHFLGAFLQKKNEPLPFVIPQKTKQNINNVNNYKQRK